MDRLLDVEGPHRATTAAALAMSFLQEGRDRTPCPAVAIMLAAQAQQRPRWEWVATRGETRGMAMERITVVAGDSTVDAGHASGDVYLQKYVSSSFFHARRLTGRYVVATGSGTAEGKKPSVINCKAFTNIEETAALADGRIVARDNKGRVAVFGDLRSAPLAVHDVGAKSVATGTTGTVVYFHTAEPCVSGARVIDLKALDVNASRGDGTCVQPLPLPEYRPFEVPKPRWGGGRLFCVDDALFFDPDPSSKKDSLVMVSWRHGGGSLTPIRLPTPAVVARAATAPQRVRAEMPWARYMLITHSFFNNVKALSVWDQSCGKPGSDRVISWLPVGIDGQTGGAWRHVTVSECERTVYDVVPLRMDGRWLVAGSRGVGLVDPFAPDPRDDPAEVTPEAAWADVPWGA